jgi:hypothetical protein
MEIKKPRKRMESRRKNIGKGRNGVVGVHEGCNEMI